MSVAFEQLDDPGLGLMIFSGLVTRNDLVSAARAILTGEIDLGRNLLGYFAPGADLNEISSNEIIELRDAVLAAAQEIAPGARIRSALISCNPADAAILELWTFYCAAEPNYPIDVRHVDALSQAADWLGLDASKEARLCELLTSRDLA